MNEEKLIPVPVGPHGVELRDLDGMFRFATCYLQSGLAPASFKNAQQLVIAWAKAAELGLSPLQAVEGMAIIGNRVGLMGDLALAMVESSGLLVEKKVEYSGVGAERSCTITITRKGRKPAPYTFNVSDAKQAGLWGKPGPWSQYPDRMLRYRALGFALRDEFPDVLKGTKTVEELQDYPDVLANDEEKIRDNQRYDEQVKAAPPPGVKIVEDTGKSKKPTPAEALEPAFPQDAQKPPAFAQRLDEDFQQPQQPPLAPEHKDDPYVKEPPDDLDMSGSMKPEEPEEPEESAEDLSWKEHVIKTIDNEHFMNHKVGDLIPRYLKVVEHQWLPVVTGQWESANDAQRADALALQKAIAFSKAQKPW